MFAGIIEELGRVRRNAVEADGRLHLAATEVLEGVHLGDSIAVNGCCLTVVETTDGGFVADVMPETARCTTLGGLVAGDAVNLEAALAYGERVGGHIVSGHVDGVGHVVERHHDGNAVWVAVEAPAAVMRYLVPKGCVAVDGISLTVVEVDLDARRFTVSLIPHTVGVTTALTWGPGVSVNLEVDLMAKYVERSVAAHVASALRGRGPRAAASTRAAASK